MKTMRVYLVFTKERRVVKGPKLTERRAIQLLRTWSDQGIVLITWPKDRKFPKKLSAA